jgi:hypothetical protein
MENDYIHSLLTETYLYFYEVLTEIRSTHMVLWYFAGHQDRN